MEFTNWIIIFIFIALIYLYYKYQKIEKYESTKTYYTKPIKRMRTYTFPHHDMIKHMTYSAGPFDHSIWEYAEQGGKSIKSQKYQPSF